MYTLDSPLMGIGQAPAYAVQVWLQKKNPHVPVDIASTMAHECALSGLNSDLCMAQCCHETGFFSSDWFVNHRNPAGVGVTGQPGVGITFPTVEAGLHAYVAHLLTYIDGASNPLKADDPRYADTLSSDMFGKAHTIQDLEQHWAYSKPAVYAATPPDQRYAAKIAALANDLISTLGTTMPNTDDSTATWTPSVNFDAGRGGVVIDRIILHTTEGGFDGSLHWLQGPPASSNTNSSAHYIVSADGATVDQMVREADTAWAAGVYAWNQRSINIEQEGYAGKGGFSDGLYQTVGALVGRIAKRHGIPLDRAHVIGHMDVPAPNNHTDPGPLYDFARILSIASGTNAPQQPTSNAYTDPVTGYVIRDGMLARYQQVKGALATINPDEVLLVIGRPVENEHADSDGFTRQKFEHCVLTWKSGQSPDRFDILEETINPYTAP